MKIHVYLSPILLLISSGASQAQLNTSAQCIAYGTNPAEQSSERIAQCIANGPTPTFTTHASAYAAAGYGTLKSAAKASNAQNQYQFATAKSSTSFADTFSIDSKVQDGKLGTGKIFLRHDFLSNLGITISPDRIPTESYTQYRLSASVRSGSIHESHTSATLETKFRYTGLYYQPPLAGEAYTIEWNSYILTNGITSPWLEVESSYPIAFSSTNGLEVPFSFTFGLPITFRIELSLYSQVSGAGTIAETLALNSVYWSGISVADSESPVSYTLNSHSGTDWSNDFFALSVPELGRAEMLISGLLCVILIATRRRQALDSVQSMPTIAHLRYPLKAFTSPSAEA